VLLEEGSVHVPNSKSLLVTEIEKLSGNARCFNKMGTRAVIKFFFPVRQGMEVNSRHFDRNIRGTCTIVGHRQKLGGPV